jgi:hypothetical protein
MDERADPARGGERGHDHRGRHLLHRLQDGVAGGALGMLGHAEHEVVNDVDAVGDADRHQQHRHDRGNGKEGRPKPHHRSHGPGHGRDDYEQRQHDPPQRAQREVEQERRGHDDPPEHVPQVFFREAPHLAFDDRASSHDHPLRADRRLARDRLEIPVHLDLVGALVELPDDEGGVAVPAHHGAQHHAIREHRLSDRVRLFLRGGRLLEEGPHIEQVFVADDVVDLREAHEIAVVDRFELGHRLGEVLHQRQRLRREDAVRTVVDDHEERRVLDAEVLLHPVVEFEFLVIRRHHGAHVGLDVELGDAQREEGRRRREERDGEPRMVDDAPIQEAQRFSARRSISRKRRCPNAALRAAIGFFWSARNGIKRAPCGPAAISTGPESSGSRRRQSRRPQAEGAGVDGIARLRLAARAVALARRPLWGRAGWGKQGHPLPIGSGA